MLAKLHVELDQASEVRVAYAYGSLLESERVHDVDIGVFLDDAFLKQQMIIVDSLTVRLSATVGVPVDVRVLNDAPMTFLYHVLRGRLLLCRDEEFLTDMLEDVARRYLDIAPFLRDATKDAFAA